MLLETMQDMTDQGSELAAKRRRREEFALDCATRRGARRGASALREDTDLGRPDRAQSSSETSTSGKRTLSGR